MDELLESPAGDLRPVPGMYTILVVLEGENEKIAQPGQVGMKGVIRAIQQAHTKYGTLGEKNIKVLVEFPNNLGTHEVTPKLKELFEKA